MTAAQRALADRYPAAAYVAHMATGGRYGARGALALWDAMASRIIGGNA